MPGMTVVQTISQLEAHSAPAARTLLELAVYEALCDEVDRVRPGLEQDVAKALSRKAAEGLVLLARNPGAGDVEVADHLARLVTVGKADTDTLERDWHGKDPGERDDASGRFLPKSGGIRRSILNALGLFSSQQPDKEMGARARGVAQLIAGTTADPKYDRARALGAGLIATQDPTMRAAGTALRLVGDIGPEAQKVLEPGIRRTAYRYRGTERRPKQELQQMAASLAAGAADDDRKRLATLSALGVSSLISQIPDRDSAKISLAAGKMPPSVGLMFDGRGRVVSEAMGFNGDHYLPFDLKNLKRMHGGSYVRTRTSGGLTDEDIYTGLMTGARHMTVVSNSGVFTLEFDPDMRGGRRYSDKARQMVDRYARLTAAIGSEELRRNDLPPEQIRELKQDALRQAGGNATLAESLFQAKKTQALAAAEFAGLDEDEILAEAEQRALAQPNAKQMSRQALARAVKFYETAIREEEQKRSVRRYRLDGEGYQAALKALEREFPFFIRSTSFEPLQRYMDQRGLGDPDAPRRRGGGSDMGYVSRGGLYPSGARNVGMPTREKTPAGEAKQGEQGQGDAPKPGEAKAGATGATGTTGAVQAGTAPKAGLQQKIAEAAESRVPDVSEAMRTSLGVYNAIDDQGRAAAFGIALDRDGQPDAPERALAFPDGQYVDWLQNKFEGNFTKAAQFLAKADPRHLDKVLAGIDVAEKASRLGNVQGFEAKDFERARQVLGGMRKLRQPFAPGAVDLAAEPPFEQTDPQAVPEVLALGTDAEAIAQGRGLPREVLLQAEGYSDMTDKDIREDIAASAKMLRGMKQWAASETGQAPLGLNTPEAREAFELYQADPENAPVVTQLATKHKAWALKRMAEVVGLATTGAAVPFAVPATPAQGPPKEDAAKRSTPSRLVWHGPDSPVVKALSRSARPSLRAVRLPASR